MRRLLKLFRKRKFQTVLDSELHFHVEQKTSDLIAQGVDPAEARRRAMAKLGGMEAIKQEYRESRATHFLESIFQDIRYALRTLRRSPRFTAVAILTLALGIGANTSIFTLLDQMMLRRLPVDHPEQLQMIWPAARPTGLGVDRIESQQPAGMRHRVRLGAAAEIGVQVLATLVVDVGGIDMGAEQVGVERDVAEYAIGLQKVFELFTQCRENGHAVVDRDHAAVPFLARHAREMVREAAVARDEIDQRKRAEEALASVKPEDVDAYLALEAALRRSNLRLDAAKRFRSSRHPNYPEE